MKIVNLFGLLITCAPMLLACSRQADDAVIAPPDSKTLAVLEWPGYDVRDFWTDFATRHPDTKVNFEIVAADADVYEKTKTGATDVVHAYTGWLQPYVDEGLLEEIDVSRLANWDKVPEIFRKIGRFHGKQYFVPWDWGFASVLYRTDKVQKPIDSWSALLDPAFNGHLSAWDDGPGMVAVSSYIRGHDVTSITPQQLSAIKAEWTGQRPLNLFYWGSEPELNAGIAKGDVWVAYAWQSAYAALLNQGVPVAFANLKEGRNAWVGMYGIRKGTPNLSLALRFLDEKLGSATSANLVHRMSYGAANQDVMTGLTDATLRQAFAIDDPSILQRTHFNPNLTDAQRNDRTALWTEVKAASPQEPR